ncbi:uncharacterized protein LOC134396753 [Elgaria multicarinata webbii]|uniref:uncharacterized protein LOC134396753 n=1 Tax=Elgaria multicarinata webbii TaxID=159646 RepID=UPI002FCD31D3
MAPRIRLNLAKPLPTISEAFEDIIEDITSNTKGLGNVYLSQDSCSGEDYLQSICHLSRPTFPIPPESKCKVQDMDKPGMPHNSHRVLNLPETPKLISRYTLPNIMSLERSSFILDCIKTYSSSRVDPLEELYTESQKIQWRRCPNCSEHSGIDYSQHNVHSTSLFLPQEKAMAKQDIVSFPRLPSPRPLQRENSCPELKCLKNQGRVPTLESSSNEEENNPLLVNSKSIWLHSPRGMPLSAKILSSSQRGQQTLKTVACPERERLRPSINNLKVKEEASNQEGCVGYFHVDQKTMSRGWISQYQSAWKKAKVRACLLPAIAES